MTLPRHRARYIAPAAIIVVAAIGYWTLFQGARANPERLSQLVVEQPGIAGLKPKASGSETVAPSKSAWSEIKKAAVAEPGQTGGYTRSWQGTKGTGSSLSILVEYLPSASDAIRLQQQMVASYTNAKTLKTDDVTVTSHFSVSGIAGSRGISYHQSSSEGTSNGTVTIFGVGRTVALVYFEAPASQGTIDVRAAARSQFALLEQQESGFSMLEPTRSLTASLLYWLIAVVLAGVAFVVPVVIGRARERANERKAVRSNYGRQARGSKVLRNKQTSPLTQLHRQRPARSSKLTSPFKR
jgi:hypothetical protein